MAKKTTNNMGMYALQCEKCKKIIFSKKELRGDLKELAIMEDTINDWVSGKIKILPEMSLYVRTFIQEAVHQEIEDFVCDVLYEQKNCKCGPYSVVKRNARKKWMKWERIL